MVLVESLKGAHRTNISELYYSVTTRYFISLLVFVVSDFLKIKFLAKMFAYLTF